MKREMTIAALLFTLVHAGAAMASDQLNPLTGKPLQETSGQETKKAVDTKQSQPASMAPGQFGPALQPVDHGTYMVPPPPGGGIGGPTTSRSIEPQKKELEPHEFYSVDGVVNDMIVIRDNRDPDRTFTVDNLDELDNEGVVKYPKILFGKEAKKALKDNKDRDQLAAMVLKLTRENARIKEDLRQKSRTKKTAEAEITALKRKSDDEIARITRKYEGSAKDHEMGKAALNRQIEDLSKQVATLRERAKGYETCVASSKDAMNDFSLLTGILYNSNLGTNYNVPKVGKFKGVLHNDLLFAFVPLGQKDAADKYMKATTYRAYKTDNYIMYINSKNLVE